MSDTTSASASTQERPCPECGELVRPGLVRCWNCGAFMRRDLEQKYMELQAGPRKVFFSPLPADAEIHAVGTIADDDDDDDDFVLEPVKPDLPTAPAAETKPDAPKPDAPTGSPAGPASTGGADVAHSVATGGDALLDIALREEIESLRKQKKSRRMTGGARTATGFVIFCPYGCRIEVRDSHRGMTGRCPKCRAPFLVPTDPPDYSAAKKESLPTDAAATAAAGGIAMWLTDLHVHTVSPEKLKLKADSLLKDFVEKDFGFSPDKLLVVSFAKKSGGLFGGGGGGDKKKGDPRELLLAHLREGKSIDELPVAEKRFFTPDEVRQMRIVQPAASRMDSMFHGVPVFGAHRIAVQLPVQEGDPQFVSFPLMSFREFARGLAQNFGIPDFGADFGIPLKDEFQPFKCHYSEAQIKALKNVEWYQADASSKVILAGWKCESCGLVVSEEARKKEKLGGANGKGLAKAICPKCKKKFGEHPLYTLQDFAASPSMAEAMPDKAPAPPEPAAS